jgi:peptidoglycan/LPS O-acetylase OafA/YrhL
METRRDNPGLLFVQVLLWVLGIASLLGPLAIPFGAAPDRAYWIHASVLVLVGLVACIAAHLVRKRNRVGMFLVLGAAALAILAPPALQGSVPVARTAVWVGVVVLLLINRREFEPVSHST